MISSLKHFAASLFGLRLVPRVWRLPCFVMLGVAAGVGLFVLHVSRATSYLSDAPETCMNCHVMRTQYLTWQHSSHASVTTCNDCHVPHAVSKAPMVKMQHPDYESTARVFTPTATSPAPTATCPTGPRGG